MKYSLTIDVSDVPNEKGFYEARGVYRDGEGNWTQIEMRSFGRSPFRAVGFFMEDFGSYLKTVEPEVRN